MEFEKINLFKPWLLKGVHPVNMEMAPLRSHFGSTYFFFSVVVLLEIRVGISVEFYP